MDTLPSPSNSSRSSHLLEDETNRKSSLSQHGETDSQAGSNTNAGETIKQPVIQRPVPFSQHVPIQRSTSAPPQLALEGLLDGILDREMNGSGNGNGNGNGHNTNGGGEFDSAEPGQSAATATGFNTNNVGYGDTILVNGENVRLDDQRWTLEYYNYYFSQKPLDPRLPPPLISRRHAHSFLPNSSFDPRSLTLTGDSPQLGSAAMNSSTADELSALSSLDSSTSSDGPTVGGGPGSTVAVDGSASSTPSTYTGFSSVHDSSTTSPGSLTSANELESRLTAMSLAPTNSDNSAVPTNSNLFQTSATAAPLSTQPNGYMNPSSQPFFAPPTQTDYAHPAAIAAAANFYTQQQPTGFAPQGYRVAPNSNLLALMNYPGQQYLHPSSVPNPLMQRHIYPAVGVGSPLLQMQGNVDAQAAAAMAMYSQQMRAAAAAGGVVGVPVGVNVGVPPPNHMQSAPGPVGASMYGAQPYGIYQTAQPQPQSQPPSRRDSSFRHDRHGGMAGHSNAGGATGLSQQRHGQPHGHGQTHPTSSNTHGAHSQFPSNSLLHVGLDGGLMTHPPSSAVHPHPHAHPHPHVHSYPHPSSHSSSSAVALHSLLDDFRSSKAVANYTLTDVVNRGLLADLSVDQHGSRFVQQRLEVADEEEKEIACQAIVADIIRLSHDVFGNYVVQKFLDHANPNQRRTLCRALRGHILALSLQMYGCRVAQRALDTTVNDLELQKLIITELNGHVMQCVRDQNGNHVIQKCIERVPPHLIGFIVDVFQHQIYTLSIHPYGCRVIQRLLEHCTEAHRKYILDEIIQNVDELCRNQYGNYVIQHILKHGSGFHKSAIFRVITGMGPTNGNTNANGENTQSTNGGNGVISANSSKVLQMAKHKYASNVVEKCFTHASPSDRQYLIDQILGSGVDPPIDPAHSPFIAMVKDQYGNYVCQKMLDEATPAERTNMINRIRQFGSTLKKIPYGKHIIARIEKLTGQPFNTDADETSSLLPTANGQSPLSVPSSANSTSVLPIESNLSIPVASTTAMTFTSPPGLPVNPLHRQ